MEGRIGTICRMLPKTGVFADVGCDHGYMAQYMLENGLCEKAYISDISDKCLRKAEKLLHPYIESGKCVPVVCDGLKGIPKPCDLVLIAGMGGEEIVRILLEGYLPPRFLFQPMKNTEKLRRFLVGRGANLQRDLTFSDGKKYYDVLLGAAFPADTYTEREYRFGRDNLKGASPSFVRQMREELEKTDERLKLTLKESSRAALLARKAELTEIIYETERNL